MFESKNKKFKKPHLVLLKGKKIYKNLFENIYALKILENCFLKIEQINSVIKTIKRILKKKNILFLKIFPDFVLTKKPKDIRMGRGKGNVFCKVFKLIRGTIISNIKYNNEYLVNKALKLAILKLPVKTIIIKNIIKW